MTSTNSSNGSSEGGIVLGMLGIAFVVLKLTGVIDWPWKWVTLPFWGGLALMLIIITLGAAGVGIWAGIAALRDRTKKD